MVANLCDAVMLGVARSGVLTHDNLDVAANVIRAEVKALVLGESYVNERAAVLAGAVPDGAVVAVVVLECCSKIRVAE